MKKLLLPILLTLCYSACFISCKKGDEKSNCMIHNFYIRSLGIAFSGFSAADLDTVIRLRYSGGSNLSDLLSADTLINTDSSFFVMDDAVYLRHDSSNYGYFWLLENQIDYRVILPSVNRTYTITGTSVGPEYTPYQGYAPCREVQNITTLINTHVDGVPVYPSTSDFDPGTPYIFLKR